MPLWISATAAGCGTRTWSHQAVDEHRLGPVRRDVLRQQVDLAPCLAYGLLSHYQHVLVAHQTVGLPQDERVCSLPLATSDSISWNPGRASVVPDMAASSYSLTMVNPWASADSWASSRYCSMFASFCECDENR